MYHAIAIVLTIRLLFWCGVARNVPLQYCGSFLGTILIAAASYELMERRFIHAKVRFSRVVSGDNAAA
jgi:peptidoglycan/LPS O-acetylase OafA/YrhL